MTGTGIDQMLSEAAAAGDVPGVAAAVLDPDGVVYEGVAGRVRIDREDEVTPNTIFWLASMTKALVAVGVLQLVERGELDLDAEVASIVPEFGELQVLEGYDGDEPRLRPPASRATVRQLLTHTSGVGYVFLAADVARWHQLTGCAEPLECSRDFLRAPLVADPGTRWDYGAGFDWAGRVLEEVSGTTLDSYLADNVFAPLGMGDTSFRLRVDQRERLMPIHHRTADGGLAVDDELELPHEPPMSCGGHGSYGTVGDYARFLRMLLRGGELDGERILREETVELAASPQLGAIELPKEMPSADHELSNDVVALPFEQSFGLGFNLMLEDIPGMRRAGSFSWSGLANCYYWIDPASQLAGVFLTSVLPFFDEQVLMRVAQLEMAAYAEAPEPAAA
jgi:CubicO group peptidase (beta-lactamase class C family)